jgi:DNA-binding CsgD family transcriptional regulator
MTHSAETVSNLLGLLYEAAASPEQWPAFLQAVGDAGGSDDSYFVLVDPENRCIFTPNPGFDSGSRQAYAEYFFRHDVLLERFIAAKQIHGEWIGTSQSVISDQEYHRSLIFNEFTVPLGRMHQCGALLGGLQAGLEGGIGFQRVAQKGAFGAEAVGLLALLAPHVKRALCTHRALTQARDQQGMLRQTVETIGHPLMSLDAHGKVRRLSSTAQAILDLRDGLELDRGRLRASVPGQHVQLCELIAGAAATGSGRGAQFGVRYSTAGAPQAGGGSIWTPSPGGAMLITRRPPRRPLQLMVTPFHSGEVLVDDRPAALVFLTDPDAQPASRATVLQAFYGLTPTECRLAELLAQGWELAQIAGKLHVAVGTVRTHLKSIYRKTGTGRQADLVRLVLGLPGRGTGEG